MSFAACVTINFKESDSITINNDTLFNENVIFNCILYSLTNHQLNMNSKTIYVILTYSTRFVILYDIPSQGHHFNFFSFSLGATAPPPAPSNDASVPSTVTNKKFHRSVSTCLSGRWMDIVNHRNHRSIENPIQDPIGCKHWRCCSVAMECPPDRIGCTSSRTPNPLLTLYNYVVNNVILYFYS